MLLAQRRLMTVTRVACVKHPGRVWWLGKGELGSAWLEHAGPRLLSPRDVLTHPKWVRDSAGAELNGEGVGWPGTARPASEHAGWFSLRLPQVLWTCRCTPDW